MQGNLNPSASVAIAGVIPPQQATVGTLTSGYVDMATFFAILATVSVGVIGTGGTLDAQIEQATTIGGANAKPVAGSAITQLVKAGGDNRQVAINVRQEDLDKNGGFRFVRLTATVGGAATFLSGLLVGFDARYGTGTANQANTVAQTVS
jgi:hypothetical protein